VRLLDIGGRQMSLADEVKVPIRHADRFFIGGQWVQPSSDATIKVIDSGTERLFFSVAEAQAADISRAVEAARQAFDAGPWPRLTHAERAGYLRAIGAELGGRSDDIGQIWPIYGLNASVFTNDVDRARQVAGQLRSGTVGHNAFRTDFSVSFGGFKQSGIGREGGREGLLPFLETKFVILEGRPAGYEDTTL
jgi:acyl-CoA reductase-like NAD-dependent aldehyde dehydrogenase